MHSLPGKRSVMVLLAMAALAFLVPGQASADFAAYTINIGNVSSPGFAGETPPYGSVLVDRTSPATATITFSSNLIWDATGGSTAIPDIYSFFGPNAMVAVNVNATSFTSAFYQATNEFGVVQPAGSNGSNTWYTQITSGAQMDGFGTFNLAYTGPSVGQTIGTTATKYDIDAVVFTLFNAAGWGSAADVLINTIAGGSDPGLYLLAAHEANDLTGNTGYTTCGGGGPNPIPLPPSALLLGSGLVGLVGLGWRRRKTNV